MTRKKSCLGIVIGLAGLFVLLLAASAASNAALPTHSAVTTRLDDLEKARLSEVLQLRAALGDEVWPGWAQADIPLMVYNEQYAFLLGYADPPPGWQKVPSGEARGGPWEAVPGDLFEGQRYYRTPITDPTKTPEGFTVLVGGHWVATFQTREYGEVAFYQGFRDELPPVLSAFVPVRLAWRFLMGKTDSYIAAFEHESFHAYEGALAPQMLRRSESLYGVAEAYPYDEMAEAWSQELSVLVRAAQAPGAAEKRALAGQFLQLRSARRSALTPEQVELEQVREWEEGLAKYAELELSRRAESTRDYQPVPQVLADADFQQYKGQQQFWLQQLREARQTQGRSGDTRFYYSGNAIAVVLDSLLPGWKARALPGRESLDALLVDALGP